MSLEPSDSRSPYTLSLLITLDAFPKQIKATHGMLGRGMALYSSNSFLHGTDKRPANSQANVPPKQTCSAPVPAERQHSPRTRPNQCRRRPSEGKHVSIHMDRRATREPILLEVNRTVFHTAIAAIIAKLTILTCCDWHRHR